jgi:4-hydroxythreonine-4-phosphate dehydrogenase
MRIKRKECIRGGRQMDRKVIGITMGDPAGVGAEITAKTLGKPEIYERCKPIVVGDTGIMARACKLAGRDDLSIHPVQKVSEALFQYGTIDVLDMKLIGIDDYEIGQVSAKAGDAAFQYVKKVIELAMTGEVDATVTNPLNKEAINLAGHHFSGHTEIYAELTKTSRYTMMLAHKELRVVHVSTHVSLREACDRVKKARVLEVIRIADQACRNMGIDKPKIGVAGLNPHCGEGGLFGREELEEITPAIEEAVREGILAYGPVPPDSIFSKARGGWYDVVVAMYHDQGHIPLKVIGFVYSREKKQWEAVEGVNITLGLPIIRTSVDHGTAFDQAGTGRANELSLINAIDYANSFAQKRNVTAVS